MCLQILVKIFRPLIYFFLGVLVTILFILAVFFIFKDKIIPAIPILPPNTVIGPENSPISGWRIYTNYKHDFSLQCPFDWQIINFASNLEEIEAISDADTITMFPNSDHEHYQLGYIEISVLQAMPTKYYNPNFVKKIQLNSNIEALVIESMSSYSYLIAYPLGKKFIEIHRDRKGGDGLDQAKILSTFHFTDSFSFVCPKTEYVDCMPKVVDENSLVEDLDAKFCTSEYLSWAEKNCPNFKGAAY